MKRRREMSEASTEDCKAFLKKIAAENGWPEDGKWKRARKVKTEEGWEREFEHPQGFRAVVVEPFGAGAEGLRLAPAERIEARQSKESEGLISWEAANEAQKAALRWIDFQRVIGRKKAIGSPDPGFGGLSWEKLKKQWHDYSGNVDKDDLYDTVSEWVKEGMSDEVGKRMMLSRVRFAYANDTDWMDKNGYWSALEGSHFYAWGADCPGEELGTYPHPFDEMMSGVMEGCWALGEGAVSGKEAMIRTWEELKAMGVEWDQDMQERFEGSGDEDEDQPLHEKLHEMIPELVARKEALALSAAAKTARGPGGKRAI